MSYKNQIVTPLFGFIFSLAILFPNAVEFTHFFEDHEHVACTDVTQHLHETQVDCSICMFHFSPVAFDLDSTDFQVFGIPADQVTDNTQINLHNYLYRFNPNRGPPPTI